MFDLDGVLVDFKQLHKDSFIQAWNTYFEKHIITDDFYRQYLEALSTKQKLAFLKEKYQLTDDTTPVYNLKQALTNELLDKAHIHKNVVNALKWAYENNIPYSCCSNSIKSTVFKSLSKICPTEWFSYILSNEDVANPKPSPDIYSEIITKTGLSNDEILVFEDSENGKTAARLAGLQIIDIVDSLDITPGFLERISIHKNLQLPKMFNVVIPMAGLGSRFMNVGYKTPKPFLPLNGIPMYRFVIDNIVPLKFREITNIHLIVRSEMVSLFTDDLSSIANLQIHTISELTEGAACTVLTVRNKINNDFPLIIANSDQYLEWDSENFFRCLIHPDWDGVISTFYQPNTSDIRWSYAAVNEDGQVTNVEEKKYISSLATTGVYGWSKGSDYVKYADKMIENNKRVNNEFYVCPVYNEAISDSSKIRVLNVYKMWGIGVPDDYEFFLKTFFKS